MNILRNMLKIRLQIITRIDKFNTRKVLVPNIFLYLCIGFCISYQEIQNANIGIELIFS